jgi:hypothetical protein
MPETEARRWWDDVAHLRDSIERRRADEVGAGRLRRDRARAADLADEAFLRGQAERADDDLEMRRRQAGRFEGPGSASTHAASTHASTRATAKARGHERARRVATATVTDDELPFSERALTPPARRRTVEITGRTIGAPSLPRLVEIDRRRPPRSGAQRIGHRPDRLALWAVILAFFLILVAATSASHAATPHGAPAHAAATR